MALTLQTKKRLAFGFVFLLIGPAVFIAVSLLNRRERPIRNPFAEDWERIEYFSDHTLGNRQAQEIEQRTSSGRTTTSSSSTTSRSLSAITTSVPNGTFNIKSTILVLSTTFDENLRPSVGNARVTLKSFGANYVEHQVIIRSVFGSTQSIGLPQLYDSNTGAPLYSGIVLTDGALAYQNNEGAWVSALSTEEWSILNDYCLTFGVRTVNLFVYPGLQSGLIAPAYGTSEAEKMVFDEDIINSCDDTITGGLRSDAEFELKANQIWHYRPTLNLASLAVGETLRPVIRYTRDNTVAAAIVSKGGREEYQFYMDSAWWSEHGVAYGNSWFSWMTRHQYYGYRRVVLSAQIDDLLLSTENWNVEERRRGASGEPAYRASANDFNHMIGFQNWLNTDILPAGSDFRCEWAINGNGVGLYKDLHSSENDPLFSAMQSQWDLGNYFYVSHTWDHLDLTCPEKDCVAYGATTSKQSRETIRSNQEFVRKELNQQSTYWSSESIVTPHISGLTGTYGGPDALKELDTAGIHSVVGDNSIARLQPENRYNGIWTSVRDFGYEGIFIIPRFATRVFYDCATPEENADEHDFLFGPTGLFSYFTEVLSWSQIMDMEAEFVVNKLLSYRWDPYMFHQANVHVFDYDDTTHTDGKTSLLGTWLEAVTKRYSSIMTLPVLTFGQDDLAEHVKDRTARDACGIDTTYSYVNGEVVSITVESTDATRDRYCTSTSVYLTGFKKPEGASWPQDVSEEIYGTDSNIRIPLSRGQVRTIPVERAVVDYDALMCKNTVN